MRKSPVNLSSLGIYGRRIASPASGEVKRINLPLPNVVRLRGRVCTCVPSNGKRKDGPVDLLGPGEVHHVPPVPSVPVPMLRAFVGLGAPGKIHVSPAPGPGPSVGSLGRPTLRHQQATTLRPGFVRRRNTSGEGNPSGGTEVPEAGMRVRSLFTLKPLGFLGPKEAVPGLGIPCFRWVRSCGDFSFRCRGSIYSGVRII